MGGQRDLIDPAKMPLTRLANSIIDGVERRSAPVADEIRNILHPTLFVYRAGSPAPLRARQAQQWDPISNGRAKFSARILKSPRRRSRRAARRGGGCGRRRDPGR